MKRLTINHAHTPKPSSTRMRSPGVSYSDERCSIWGLATRAVITVSTIRKSVRTATPPNQTCGDGLGSVFFSGLAGKGVSAAIAHSHISSPKKVSLIALQQQEVILFI